MFLVSILREVVGECLYKTVWGMADRQHRSRSPPRRRVMTRPTHGRRSHLPLRDATADFETKQWRVLLEEQAALRVEQQRLREETVRGHEEQQ